MPITNEGLTYPTAAEMEQIAQDLLPRLQADRPIFDIMPIRSVDAFELIWEQESIFTGLQGWRGMNGAPGRVAQVSVNQYKVDPGVYGEYMLIDEMMLTRRRAYGTPLAPIPIVDLVTDNLTKLLQRRLDRIETIGWNILQGSYSVSAPNGAIMITDSYNVQTYTATPAWSNRTTAVPTSDFSAVKLKHRGHSTSFGGSAKAYANQGTINNLLLCENTADPLGRRIPGLMSNNLGDTNKILQGADLPEIVAYDEGYVDDNGVFQLYIPNGIVIVVGKRPAAQRVAEYRMVRNAANPNAAPGAYTRVELKPEIPPQVQVHDGHNGGPVLYFPSSIVVMSV